MIWFWFRYELNGHSWECSRRPIARSISVAGPVSFHPPYPAPKSPCCIHSLLWLDAPPSKIPYYLEAVPVAVEPYTPRSPHHAVWDSCINLRTLLQPDFGKVTSHLWMRRCIISGSMGAAAAFADCWKKATLCTLTIQNVIVWSQEELAGSIQWTFSAFALAEVILPNLSALAVARRSRCKSLLFSWRLLFFPLFLVIFFSTDESPFGILENRSLLGYDCGRFSCREYSQCHRLLRPRYTLSWVQMRSSLTSALYVNKYAAWQRKVTG